MHNSKVVEPDLRRWLAGRLVGTWHSFIEPSTGSTMGTPDLLLLLPGCQLPLPVELKVAEVRRDHLRPRHLRAAQIAWHDKLARAGGRSCLLLGVQCSLGFTAYVLPDCRHEMLRRWRSGFPGGAVTCVARPAIPATGVASLVLDLEGWKRCMALEQPHPAPEEAPGALFSSAM